MPRSQLLCLPEECKRPCKNLGQFFPSWLKDSTLGQKAFSTPHSNQLARTLLTHADFLSQVSWPGALWALHTKLLEGFPISRMHSCVHCEHMYCGRGEISFRGSFEDAFKALTSGRAHMTCGQRHLWAAYVFFLPSMQFDRVSLGLGKRRWGKAEECLHFLCCQKPLHGLGFVSPKQTPISNVRPGCFDFTSFGI